MSLSPHEYIRHILDEIDYILTQISDTDFYSFFKDATLKRAFVRSLEIIGEASKRLPEDIKAMQPDVEWRKVTGMRDKLIHGYFGVDYTIVGMLQQPNCLTSARSSKPFLMQPRRANKPVHLTLKAMAFSRYLGLKKALVLPKLRGSFWRR